MSKQRVDYEMKKRTQAQRTPGPWKADEWTTGYTVYAPDSHYLVCHLQNCSNGEANAAFIVRACNSHDELVQALQSLVAPESPAPPTAETVAKARAALAKATKTI